MARTGLFIFLMMILAGLPAFSASDTPQTITLDGKLYSSADSTSPLLDPTVNVVIEILSADKTCVLYEEQQTLDTTLSEGSFNIQIGSAVGDIKRTPNDSANAMATIFQNLSPIPGKGNTCASPYAPVAAKQRYLRLIVTPTAGAAETLTPDMLVDSVPNAMVAETIQGKDISQLLVLGAGSLTQANTENIFSTTNYPTLLNLLSGTDPSYVEVGSSGAAMPALSSNPVTPATGSVWYDSTNNVLKFYDGSVVQTVSENGHNAVQSVTAGTGLSGGTITSTGTISIAAGGVTSAMLDPAINISTTGSISTSGNISGTNISATTLSGQTLRLFEPTNTFEITMQAPVALAANYSLTLPLAAGGSGQVMSTSGAGVLTWMTPITGVTAGSGLSGGGTSGSVSLAIAPTGVTAGNYGTATQVPSFTLGTDGRLTAAGNITISGVAPAGAAGGDLMGTYPNPTLIASGVTAATYGTASSVGTFVVDPKGRVTSAGNTSIAIDGSAITSGTVGATRMPAFTGDATSSAGAVNLTLANSGVVANVYGSSTAIPQITVDAKGRITSATTNTLSASNITTGVLPLANGGTGQSSAAAAFNALSPMTALGDIEYESAANTASRLAGNTSATKKYLSQTGTGAVSAAPVWAQPAFSDLSGSVAAAQMPAMTGDATSSAGAVNLTLANSGVVANVYGSSTAIPQITVDAKGRITSATTNTLSASNITTGVLPVANGGTGTSTGSITGTSALNFAAGGSNQNVTLTPSGSGYTLLGGNVGIGSTTPGSRLTVNGVVESTFGGVKFPDGTVQTTAAAGSAPYYYFWRTSGGCGSITTSVTWGDCGIGTSFTPTKSGTAILTFTSKDSYLFGASGNFGIAMSLNGSMGGNIVFITSANSAQNTVYFLAPLVDTFAVTAGTTYTFRILYLTQSWSGTINLIQGNSTYNSLTVVVP